MSVLYIALPVALIVAVIAVAAFVFQVRTGQFDDLDTPPRRILFDDCELKSGREPESRTREQGQSSHADV